MKKILLFSIASIFVLKTVAQTNPASADIYLGLKKLNVLGSVLYIAAHPDDENTRLISYFSKERMYRTGYLSLTRGDGGQNLIGDEQGIELGLIRTQELLAARRIDGGEQFFSRAFDFGYSKTPEETFAKWDKNKILSDVIWVIRKFQPDVIITRFPTTGEGGHGHHTASAILANEAFVAAADPTVFPEQLKWVSVWKPKRILWNGFNFNNATPPPGAFKLDVGGYNPVLGKSYGEIAAESRSLHKSQGFGSSGNRGEVFEWFRPTGGAEPSKDLFENVDVSWKRINAPQIQRAVDALVRDFDFMHPEQSVKGLVALHHSIRQLPASVWRTKKLSEVEQLIEACSGLYADATTSVPYVAQTDSVKVNFTLNNRLGSSIVFKKVTVEGFDSSFALPLRKNLNENFSKTIFVPSSKNITQPYWLEEEMKEGYFEVNDQLKIGQPDVQPAFTAIFSIEVEREPFEIRRPIRYRFNDPVKGEVYQPFVVVPAYTIELDPSMTIDSAITSKAVFTAHKNNTVIQLNSAPLQKNQKMEKEYPVKGPSAGNLAGGMESRTRLNSRIHYQEGTDTIARTLHQIRYDHIPTITYFSPAIFRYIEMDVKKAGKRIGYIVGAGDKVPQALEQMGYEVFLLGDKELSRNNLQQFDAIIAGVRAYNTNEWLNAYHDKLMQYVHNGGNLIVQYNTSNNIGPVRARIGPYPFDISRTRITDENSPVVFLEPEHRVLNFPNKITHDDFKGWIQERSIYHAAKRDTAFRSILGLTDPGEKSDDGSLIIAQYGRGYFTYTGLVFFRELPAGVPGAYRLIANLIALNAKKEF